MVEPRRGHEVQLGTEPRLRLQVSAQLGDVVVVLVAAGEGAAGAWHRPDEVDPVDEALTLPQPGRVLHLPHVEERVVPEPGAVPEQVRVSGITEVDVALGEQSAATQSELRVAVAPVSGLGGPDPGQLDAAPELAEAPGRDEVGALAEPDVQAALAAEPLGIEVASPDPQRVGVGPRRDRRGTGRLLERVTGHPIAPPEVAPRDLESDASADPAGVSAAHLGHLTLAGERAERRPLFGQGRPRDDVHGAIGHVGSVQGRSRAQHQLDMVDVLVGGGNHVVGVEAQRWHRRPPVVRKHEQRPREDVVEPAGHEQVLRQAAGCDIHPGDAANVIHGRGGRPRLDVPMAHDPGGGRGPQRLLLGP